MGGTLDFRLGRARCPTTSRTTLTFLVSPSSWALTYSTGWDDGARKGVYDMSAVGPQELPDRPGHKTPETEGLSCSSCPTAYAMSGDLFLCHGAVGYLPVKDCHQR